MNPRKLGRFYYSSLAIVEDGFSIESLAKVLSMLEFVPTRCEFLWHNQQFEYVGLSPMFRTLDKNEKVPTYNLVISVDEEENVVDVRVEEYDEKA